MAFDTKRLRTIKWLDKLSSKRITGLKDAYNSYKGVVLARFGRLYAQNGYILASIEYNELYHTGDDQWLKIARYVDDDGKHIEDIEFENAFPHPNNDRIFEDFFIALNMLRYDSTVTFNPYLIAECMMPFKINDISPTIWQRDHYLEFTGHNKDVSIRVLMIGELKR